MNPREPARSALGRTLRSFRFAGSGLLHLVTTQPNARVHLLATAVVACLAFWLALSPLEWAIVAWAVFAVWIAEAFNTAVEAVVDLASPEWRPLGKVAKDVAAAGVLLAALFAVTVAALVFVPAWSRSSQTSRHDGSRLDPSAVSSSTRPSP